MFIVILLLLLTPSAYGIPLDVRGLRFVDGASALPARLVRTTPLDDASWATVRRDDAPFVKLGASLVRIRDARAFELGMRAPRIMAETAPTQVVFLDYDWSGATHFSFVSTIDEMSWNDSHCLQVPFVRATTPWFGVLLMRRDGGDDNDSGRFYLFSPGRRQCSDGMVDGVVVPEHCRYRIDQCLTKAHRLAPSPNSVACAEDQMAMLLQFELNNSSLPCANARYIECGNWSSPGSRCERARVLPLRVGWSPSQTNFSLAPLRWTLERSSSRRCWTRLQINDGSLRLVDEALQVCGETIAL